MRRAANRSREFWGYLAVVAVILVLMAGGCGAGLGETAAEASRRRERVLRVNFRQMITDIDRVLMLDQPSRLTERDLP